MCKNARLNWLVACAGLAGLAAGAAASEPVSPTATRGNTSPIVTDSNGVAIGAQRVTGPAVLVDDLEALELANKLGLNDIRDPGGLRGLPTCPSILTDGGQCHVANVGLGANFSTTVAGAFRTMDNVTPVTSNPTRMCWLGRYNNRVNPPVANESFRIRIFNSLPTGLPDLGGGPIFERTFQQTGAPGVDQLELSCLDGQSCPGTTTPAVGGNFVYSANVTAGFPMNANGCYWVEIANVASAAAGTNWGWAGSQAGTDLASLQAVDGQYTTFTRVENDRALCVSGGVDPFLGNCTLPPLPPICENSEANGIGYDGIVNTGFFASVPPSPQGNGLGWNSYQFAENFSFAAPTTVSSICFQGFWQGYQNGTPVGVAVPAQPNFVITYFGNVPAGLPGAPIPAATFTTGQPGVNLIWNNNDDIRVEHPPVQFAADQCFWVSVGRVHNQPNPAVAVPIFHWLATGGTQPYADDRAAFRTAPGAGGAWGALSQAIEGSIENCNMNFLLSNGPVVARTCSAPPCAIPTGGVAENEANCGGGVEGGDTVNGGCNSPTFVTSSLACGQIKRGTVLWNGNIRDTDWYSFTLAQTQTVTLTVNAEFAGIAGFIGDANGPVPAPINCADENLQINPFMNIGSCTAASISRTLGAGTWTVFIAPNFGDQIACAGTNGNEYTVGITCEAPMVCSVPAGGTAEGEANCGLPSDTVNGGCVSTPTVFGAIACGATVRGTGAFDGAQRDTDWYQFTLATPSSVTITLNSEFASVFGLIGDSNGPLPAGFDCANEDLQINPFALGGSCTAQTVTANLAAGTWTIFVGADFDGDVVACPGTNGNEYTLQLQCTGGTVDCNGNGTPDSQEIAANPALDCYNPTVVQNPHVIGGPDGALDACQCQGNFNRDGSVNSTDISAMLTSWLAAVQAGNANADINCSGSTNSTDISAFLTIWLAQVNNQVPFDGCP